MDNYIINSNGKLYYIIYREKKILFFSNNTSKIIKEDVIKFSFKYYKNYIYITYLKQENNLYIYKLNILDNTEEEDKIVVNNIGEILYLNLEITSTSCHIILTCSNINDLTIYDLIIKDDCSLIRIKSIDCPKDIQSVFSVLVNDNIMFLICDNYKKSLYSLYEYKDNIFTVINSFILKNALNINLFGFKDKIALFYNKIEQKNVLFLYRDINLNSSINQISSEKIIFSDYKIISPKISYYNNKFHIIYHYEKIEMIVSFNSSKCNIYKSKKDKNKTSTKIIKITNEKIDILNCYSKIKYNKKIFKKNNLYTNNKVKYYNNNGLDYRLLIEKYLKEHKLKKLENDKIILINDFEKKINQLNLEKSNLLSENIHRINNLIKIIEEKDNIITKLLKRK